MSTFNIAFFADTHLGYSAYKYTDAQGVNLRVRDGEAAMHEIVKGILNSEEYIDAVVHGGDVFHRSEPSIRDIYIMQYYMREFRKRGIPCYFDSGNHDTPDNRAKMSAVSVLGDPDNNMHALYQPYEVNEISDGIFLHSVSHHGLKGDDVPQVSAVSGAINIFTAHGAALDPKNATLMSCENSPREQIIPPEMIIDEDFSMKLLGHYHSRYAVGHELLNTWYSGSTIRRGFSDAPGARGWMLVKVHPDGKTDISFKNIKQRPQYDLETIDALGKSSGEVQDLIEANIATTRLSDGFDPNNAPIVRQRVVNASRAMRAGLDRNRINSLTTHMLSWDLPMTMPEVSDESPTADASEVSLSKAGSNQTNTVQSFTDWSERSETLRNMTDEEKASAKKSAIKHLESVRSGKED